MQVSEGDEVLPASSVRQRELCVCVCVCVCAHKHFGFSSSHLLIQICQHSSYSLSLSLSLSFFFFCCRNPYGQSVGNHRAVVDHVPRKRGELVCVRVFSLLCALFLFLSSFLSFLFFFFCSISLLIEPSLP